MTLSFLYWFLMLLALLFSGWGWRAPEGRTPWGIGWGLVLWALLLVIGLQLFGFPIRGG